MLFAINNDFIEKENSLFLKILKWDKGMSPVAGRGMAQNDFLDKALSYKRLNAYGGLLKKIHKELNLGDAERVILFMWMMIRMKLLMV